MKKWIAILILCIQCLLYVSCAQSESSVHSSMESSSVTSQMERSESSSVKNEDDKPFYSFDVVDDKYTGTYEPEKWSLRVEKPEEFLETLSGPVTLREIDESAIINPITVSGEYSLPLVTNDGEIQNLMSTVNENVPICVLYNAAYHSFGTENARPSNIQDYMVPIPVSFLRNTAPGCYYTVNKVVSGGYMYLFFERPYDEERIINDQL